MPVEGEAPGFEGEEFDEPEFDEPEVDEPEFEFPVVPARLPHGEPLGVVPGFVDVFGFTVEG